MSDTPRTDAVNQCPATADGWPVVYMKMFEHARALEREVNLGKRLYDATQKWFDDPHAIGQLDAAIEEYRKAELASVTQAGAPNTAGVFSTTTGVEPLVCASCGCAHFQKMQDFDYDLSGQDYPTGHPDRCRLLDDKVFEHIIEDGKPRPHWRCHKKAWHCAGNGGEHCSTHRDCGARSDDGCVCGLKPDHEGPHGWERTSTRSATRAEWKPTHRHAEGGLYRFVEAVKVQENGLWFNAILYENEQRERFCRRASVFAARFTDIEADSSDSAGGSGG